MNRRGGSVLILAVWVLFFLTALAVAVGSQVGAMLALAGFVRDHVAQRSIGQAAAMQAAAVISGQTNTWDGITRDSWTRDAGAFTVDGLPGGRARTGFVVRDARSAVTNTGLLGESGRINLNKANERLLASYFRVAGGLSSIDALDLAKAVRARVGGDAEPTGRAPAPFTLVDELRSLSDMPAERYARLAPGLTVFGDDHLINVNSASLDVLHSLAMVEMEAAGVDDATVRRLAEWIVDLRERGFVFADRATMLEDFRKATDIRGIERLFGEMISELDVASTHFRGITYVELDGATRETAAQEFVFDRRDGRFVYWREF